MTTPDLITKHRTQFLWKQFGLLNMKGPITHLLRSVLKIDCAVYVFHISIFSLYKTLRPDKVPMQVPVITSGFAGGTGERTLTERLELAAEKAELADANPGTHNFKSIRWAIRTKVNSSHFNLFLFSHFSLQKNTKKRDIILPTIAYNVNVATIDQGKQLLDCQT
jgi:hypothetical protein